MNATVTVERPPSTQALDEAQAFLQSLGYSTRWLMSPNPSLVVAKLESNLLGIGLATIDGSTAVLMSVAVHPEFLRLGIGRRMVESLLSHLTSSGAETAYLFSRVAGEYWERIGFLRTPVAEVAAKAQGHFQVREYLADGSIWSDKAFRRDLKR
jgi:ribosomal protein S18 acetylase RimI-like enzyme